MRAQKRYNIPCAGLKKRKPLQRKTSNAGAVATVTVDRKDLDFKPPTSIWEGNMVEVDAVEVVMS